MTLAINKKGRIERHHSNQSENSLPIKILPSLHRVISTFLNLFDVFSMIKVCKAFADIPIYYLRGTNKQIQNVLLTLQKIERIYENPTINLDRLSVKWYKGFESALTTLTEIEISGKQSISFLPDDQILKILSSSPCLRKLKLTTSSQKVITTIERLPLIHLELVTDLEIDVSLLSKTLKILHLSNSKHCYFFTNFEGGLPKIETLSLKVCATENNREILQKFIALLPNLKKLDINDLNHRFIINSETFVKLPNLKELIFSSFNAIQISHLKFAQSLEIISITHLAGFKVEELVEFRSVIESLPNLKDVSFHHDANPYAYFSPIETLCTSSICELDNVNVVAKISHQDYCHNYREFKIKNFSVSIEIFPQKTVKKSKHFFLLQSMSNFKKLEFIFCPKYTTVFHEDYDKENFSEEFFIECIKTFSDKITSIKDKDGFIWTPNILKQLELTPFKICTDLNGYFHIENGQPMPTSTLLKFFPAAKKIERQWKDQNRFR